jgi:hypothetical protein
MTIQTQPDAIETAIIALADRLYTEDRRELWSTSEWTRRVNRGLGELGVSLGYHPCGHSCDDLPNGYREFMWDGVWGRYHDGHLAEFVLAAEHEWNPGDEEIDQDFEKLLFASATHRVMIFQDGDAEAQFARLCHILDNASHIKPGERFLLLCWWYDGFKSRVYVKGADLPMAQAAQDSREHNAALNS